MSDEFAGVTDCVVHITASEEDCDHCQAELKAKGIKLNDMVMANTLRLQNFQTQGVQVDPMNFLAAKLELLIEVIIRDPRSLVHFEAEYQRRVSEGLEGMKAEITKAKLTQGVNGAKINKIRSR